jgi:membrane-associated phospholipid phosphatase
MSLSSLFKANRYFFFGYLVFFFAALFVLLFFTKSGGFIFLNPYHSNFLNGIFIPLTYLGDGFFCIAIGLLLFVFKRRFLSLMVLSSYAISGIIAQALKNFIVEARPAVFLKASNYQYFIENVTLHNLHAFPSGHSASAFALAAVLSFELKNKNYSLLFLAAAILVGYSRIYLGEHFIDDVLAGSIIGILSAIFCWLFFAKLFNKWLLRKRKIK